MIVHSDESFAKNGTTNPVLWEGKILRIAHHGLIDATSTAV
jgi:hypothetical protein